MHNVEKENLSKEADSEMAQIITLVNKGIRTVITIFHKLIW